MDDLREGLTGSATITVGEEHTAPSIGSGRVHVLATPVMINLMEAAALDASGAPAAGRSPKSRHASQCRALCGDAGRDEACARMRSSQRSTVARSSFVSRRSMTRSASATAPTRASL